MSAARMAYRSDEPGPGAVHDVVDVFVPRFAPKVLWVLGAAAIVLLGMFSTLSLQFIQLRCHDVGGGARVGCRVREVADGQVRGRMSFLASHVAIGPYGDYVAPTVVSDGRLPGSRTEATAPVRFEVIADDATALHSFRVWNTDTVEQLRVRVADWVSSARREDLQLTVFSRASLLVSIASALLAALVIATLIALSRLGARLSYIRRDRSLRISHRSFWSRSEEETWQLAGVTEIECEPEGARAYLVLRYGLRTRPVLSGPWVQVERACARLVEITATVGIPPAQMHAVAPLPSVRP